MIRGENVVRRIVDCGDVTLYLGGSINNGRENAGGISLGPRLGKRTDKTERMGHTG